MLCLRMSLSSHQYLSVIAVRRIDGFGNTALMVNTHVGVDTKLSMFASYGQSSTSSNLLRNWWVALWRTKIPSKIKVFIWKAFHECLPTNFCLWKRGVDISPKCMFCSKYETLDHALCGCKQAEVICNIVFERVDKGIDIQNNFADRIMLLAGSLSQKEF